MLRRSKVLLRISAKYVNEQNSVNLSQEPYFGLTQDEPKPLHSFFYDIKKLHDLICSCAQKKLCIKDCSIDVEVISEKNERKKAKAQIFY